MEYIAVLIFVLKMVLCEPPSQLPRSSEASTETLVPDGDKSPS